MSGRYIGENTGLIYEVMHRCEIKNLSGILMLIDFEKAFDSISWKFACTVFQFYNFSENLTSWLKLLHSKIESMFYSVGNCLDFLL